MIADRNPLQTLYRFMMVSNPNPTSQELEKIDPPLESECLPQQKEFPFPSKESRSLEENRRNEGLSHEGLDSLVSVTAPQDHGVAAWQFLFAAAVILMATWGNPPNHGR